jgi:hypothetical protein
MTDDIALVKHLIMGTGGVWTTPIFYRICTLHTYFTPDHDNNEVDSFSSHLIEAFL